VEERSPSNSEATLLPELPTALRAVAERIERHKGTNIGEQNTKLTLINPILRALGWNVEDLEDVRHEFRRVPSDKPVDYALMLARTPRLFVEAKALDENLDDRRWANQIVSYATVAGVEWVVLTNGDEYRIYNAHAPVPVEEKLFRTVRISEDESGATEALGVLSKEQTRENSLSGLWRTYSIDRRVKEAVEVLFVPEPSPWLARRLTKELDGLAASDVRDALARARVTLDFPEQEPLPRPPEEVRRRRPTGETGKRPQRREPISDEVRQTTVRQLIAAGSIRPPLALFRTYKGRDLSAQIEPDGRVSCLGETYNSVSVAGGMARRSVVGAPPGRKYPQTNGWTFWYFRDNDGRPRQLSFLREQFVDRQQREAER
jgi:Restriction Enzyme Adenine Methylase Associated/Type I restriction enzyme R protein N terminus (HSDR_N)